MELASTRLDRWQDQAPEDAKHCLSGKARRAAVAAAPGLERRLGFLAADGQAPTPLEQEALFGANDLVEASFVERLLLVSRCVGRLRFDGAQGRGYATGFLVAPGLLMTNHHVFPDVALAQGASVQFDYKRDLAGQLLEGDEYDLDPSTFFVSHEALDFAVVAVAPRSTGGQVLAGRGHLRLNPQTGKALKGEFVTIVQYPDGQPMRIALRENEVTRADPAETVIWYKADTAHGSSGSPVFNDSFQVAALHASGHVKRADNGDFLLRAGGSTPTLVGFGEGDVVWDANVGMRVSHICPQLLAQAARDWPAHVPILEAAMQGGDVLANAVDVEKTGDGEIAEREALTGDGAARRAPVPAGGSDLVIPLQLRISLAGGVVQPRLSVAATSGEAALAAETLELRIPVIHDGLEQRKGFDARFLGGARDVPAPELTAAGLAVLAPVAGGTEALRYHKFSVWMHRERRLPLFTASNVDWTERKPIVDGQQINRETLAGFPPGKPYLEQWVTDPRLDPKHQLPDVFYSEDGGAFDKGHIVRRHDVCWGDTFDDIQMANGDTYHVTNCTPQIAGFNQSKAGVDNWGDLENHVQKASGQEHEKVVIFAGPVLAAQDRWFRGKDDAGTVHIQVPRRFWKIVVAPGGKAYGFLLGQDVTSITTEAEFFVPDNFMTAWKPIKTIAPLLRGWLDLDGLKALDQHPDA
jgi:endonuclease G